MSANPAKHSPKLEPHLKDEVFKHDQPVADFAFSKKVAAVFDDMVDRSVPFYQEMQRMVAEMARDFAVENTNIYDLGCSTGVGSSRVDLQACKLEYSIVSPK